MSMGGHVWLAPVGKATYCQVSSARSSCHSTAVRFVWHHIIPQVCGGTSNPANLVQTCDNHHYSVHALMWALASGRSIPRGTPRKQHLLARAGYDGAVSLGAADKIPNEGGD